MCTKSKINRNTNKQKKKMYNETTANIYEFMVKF